MSNLDKDRGSSSRGLCFGWVRNRSDMKRSQASRTLALFLTLAASTSLTACQGRKGRETTATATETSVDTPDATDRALACDLAWMGEDLDRYAACFAEPFTFRSNLGQEQTGLDAFVESVRSGRASMAEPSRDSIAIISDDGTVFRLWVESATVDGSRYSALFAQFWGDFDERGAFRRVDAYLDPNHVQHQLDKAPQLSRGPVESPIGPPLVGKRDDLAAEDALLVVRQLIEATSAHDLETLRQTYADGVQGVATTRAEDFRGRDQVVDGLSSQWAAFPDLRIDVIRLWGAGELVVLEGVLTGTNTGELAPGMPATGRSFEQPFVQLFEVRDGKIQRFWLVADGTGILRQLGMYG